MTQTETKPWCVWRTQRLYQILDLKAQGLTDAQVAEEMPISRATVSRELNSPQADEFRQKLKNKAEQTVWSFIENSEETPQEKDKTLSRILSKSEQHDQLKIIAKDLLIKWGASPSEITNEYRYSFPNGNYLIIDLVAKTKYGLTAVECGKIRDNRLAILKYLFDKVVWIPYDVHIEL